MNACLPRVSCSAACCPFRGRARRWACCWRWARSTVCRIALRRSRWRLPMHLPSACCCRRCWERCSSCFPWWRACRCRPRAGCRPAWPRPAWRLQPRWARAFSGWGVPRLRWRRGLARRCWQSPPFCWCWRGGGLPERTPPRARCGGSARRCCSRWPAAPRWPRCSAWECSRRRPPCWICTSAGGWAAGWRRWWQAWPRRCCRCSGRRAVGPRGGSGGHRCGCGRRCCWAA